MGDGVQSFIDAGREATARGYRVVPVTDPGEPAQRGPGTILFVRLGQGAGQVAGKIREIIASAKKIA